MKVDGNLGENPNLNRPKSASATCMDRGTKRSINTNKFSGLSPEWGVKFVYVLHLLCAKGKHIDKSPRNLRKMPGQSCENLFSAFSSSLVFPALSVRVGFWQNGFFADFYFWAADGFSRILSPELFSSFLWGKSGQIFFPGKSAAKSSKFYTTKILRHISADWPGQLMEGGAKDRLKLYGLGVPRQCPGLAMAEPTLDAF